MEEFSPPHHVSHVRCQVSGGRCHVSYISFFFDNVVELVGDGSIINGATPSSLIIPLLMWEYFNNILIFLKYMLAKISG